MTLIILFIISGLGVAGILLTKVWEGRRKKKPMLLRLVSLGDERVRVLYHEAAHHYSDYRSEAEFFFKKQLPLHSRNIFNKTSALVKEKGERYIDELRQSRLFKKNDGISEFFRNISEKEKDSQTEEDEVK